MAEAMIAGLRQHNGSFQIGAVDPSKARRQLLEKEYDLDVFEDISSAREQITGSDLVIIAVKPQTVPTLFTQLGNVFSEEGPAEHTTMLSIVAGLTMKEMRRGLKTERVVRSMPNTPSTIGQGMTVWCADKMVGDDSRAKIRKMFDSCGEQELVDTEDLLDCATALSGSGPAYFMMVMEAMEDAGVHVGLPRDLAQRLVKQTMLGTGHYASVSEKPISLLRNDITSPGGTTSEAIFHLERGGLRTVVSDACWAAYRRSRELGDKDTDVGPELNR